MKENTTDNIEYLITVNLSQKEDLGNLRKWEHLTVAFEDNLIWVKGFSPSQIESILVKSIPFVERFYAKNTKIFPYESALPQGNLPSLLWTPILRALPVALPPLNHNYFGTDEKLALKLIPSNTEKEAVALWLSIQDLEKYIVQAPEIRLKTLHWAMLNQTEVLILGTPLLPLQGKAFWKKDNFLMPVGYDFDLFVLASHLDKKVNEGNKDYIIWQENTTYFKIPKIDFKPLTLLSFRLTQIKYTR